MRSGIRLTSGFGGPSTKRLSTIFHLACLLRKTLCKRKSSRWKRRHWIPAIAHIPEDPRTTIKNSRRRIVQNRFEVVFGKIFQGSTYVAPGAVRHQMRQEKSHILQSVSWALEPDNPLGNV